MGRVFTNALTVMFSITRVSFIIRARATKANSKHILLLTMPKMDKMARLIPIAEAFFMNYCCERILKYSISSFMFSLETVVWES